MSENHKSLDINSAELVDLTGLPGIGLNTAEKIVARRPFSTIEELRDINGIGEVVFERIAPFIHVNPIQLDSGELIEVQFTSESSVVEEADATDLEIIPEEIGQAAPQEIAFTVNPEETSQESVGEPLQELPPEQSQPANPPQVDSEGTKTGSENKAEPVFTTVNEQRTPVFEQKSIQTPGAARTVSPTQSNRIFGVSLTCGVFSILFSIAITLGILFLINNGLQYTKPSDLDKTEQKLSDVSSQAYSLAREIETLTTRLDNLESIAGRVSAVEKGMEETRNEMEAISSGIESLNEQIDELDQRVAELQKTTSQFSAFIDGLKELIESIYQPTSAEK